MFFISVSPGLVSSYGHHLALENTLASQAKQAGWDYLCLSGETFDGVGADFSFQPTFAVTQWEVVGDWTGENRASFFEELRGALSQIQSDCDQPIFVYLYMGHHSLVEGWLQLFSTNSVSMRGLMNLFGSFYRPGDAGHYIELMCAGLSAAVFSTGLKFACVVTDSVPLVDAIADASSVRIPLIPFFPCQSFSDKRDCGETFRRQQSEFTIVYPSHATQGRGYETILEFLEKYAVRFESKVNFIVRFAPPTPVPPPKIDTQNVTIVEGSLSSRQYRMLLESADVILLPYDSDPFYYGTSSILGEVFSLKKFVLVQAETWLSQQVTATGAGWVAELDSAEKLDAALERVWDERKSCNDLEIHERLQDWSESQSVENFFESIMEFVQSGFPSSVSLDMSQEAIHKAFKGSMDASAALCDMKGRIAKIEESSRSESQRSRLRKPIIERSRLRPVPKLESNSSMLVPNGLQVVGARLKDG